MRKGLLLVLFISLFFACGEKKPPVTPPPPPQDICGDEICGKSETPASCPDDCADTPPPPPPPPVDKCDPQKPRSPLRGMANYGLLAQLGLDTHKIATDVRDSEKNSISIHLTSLWSQLPPNGNQPFVYDAKRGIYLLKNAQPNKAWFDQAMSLFRECACHGISVHLSLFDQYLQDHNLQAAMFKKHWGRDNDIGSRWRDPKPLYMSWDGSGTSLSDYAWLWWPSDDSAPSSAYKCETPMCKAIRDAYLFPLARGLLEIQKDFPQWRWSYKVFNEERGKQEWTGTQWHANRGKSLGGETKIHRWVYEQIFLKAGFTKAQLEEHIDTLAWTGIDHNTEYSWIVEWGNMLKTYKYVTGGPGPKRFAKAIFEIHNVESVNIVKLWSSHGISGPNVLWSMDGAKEDGTYLKRARDLFSSNVERFELKTYTDPVQNKCWSDRDMMLSWNRCFPIIEKAIQK